MEENSLVDAISSYYTVYTNTTGFKQNTNVTRTHEEYIEAFKKVPRLRAGTRITSREKIKLTPGLSPSLLYVVLINNSCNSITFLNLFIHFYFTT